MAHSGPCLMGQVAMVRCQKKRGISPWGQVENAIGCVVLHTLPGQLGFGVWLASSSPNQLHFFRSWLGHHSTMQSLVIWGTPWVTKLWTSLALLTHMCVHYFFWKWLTLAHVLWVKLHGEVSERGTSTWWSIWKWIWIYNFAHPGWSSWIRGLTGQLIP